MFGQSKNNLENKYIYNLKGSNNIDWITLNGILAAIFQDDGFSSTIYQCKSPREYVYIVPCFYDNSLLEKLKLLD